MVGVRSGKTRQFSVWVRSRLYLEDSDGSKEQVPQRLSRAMILLLFFHWIVHPQRHGFSLTQASAGLRELTAHESANQAVWR